MEKLVIDRKKWIRGKGGLDSALLRSSDFKMCCLGFYSKHCGFSDEEIRNRGDFSDFFDVDQDQIEKLNEGFFTAREWGIVTSDLHDEFVAINDMEDLSEEKREKKLKGLFLKVGIDVEFVG